MKLHTTLRHTQESLMDAIFSRFPNAIIQDGEYILVPGDIPIMLVAHLDTVHKEPVREICTSKGGEYLMSPQGIGGDDRCGVYALLKLAECGPTHHPWLLFCCEEEVGGLGSEAFAIDWSNGLLPASLGELKLVIELDRKGNNDAVYYECDNTDLEDYMTSLGWKTEWGTFTDICNICPALGVAGVNLSVGYYNQHTNGEYICLSDLTSTIQRVKQIILTIDELPRYEWVDLYDYGDLGYGKTGYLSPYLKGWAYYDDYDQQGKKTDHKYDWSYYQK